MHTCRRLAAGALASAATVFAAAAPASAATPVNLLFVQSAPSATLEPLGGDRFRLTLERAHRGVATFSDRPARVAGQETLGQFVGKWKERGFDQVPPNAALVVDRGARAADTLIVELTRPRLGENGRLSYLAKRISAPRGDALDHHASRADERLPRRLGAVHLFVDDAPSSAPREVVLWLQGTGRVGVVFDGPASVVVMPGLGGTTWSVNGNGDLRTNGAMLHSMGPVQSGQPAGVSFGVLSTATELTGTAYFDEGATSAQIQIGDRGTPVTIGEGRFSIPLG